MTILTKKNLKINSKCLIFNIIILLTIIINSILTKQFITKYGVPLNIRFFNTIISI